MKPTDIAVTASTSIEGLVLRRAVAADTQLILDFINALALYEKLSHEVAATPEALRETLFGDAAFVEVILAELHGKPAGFMLYFPNYSTFLAQPGIHIEDLVVLPDLRGLGIGRVLLAFAAQTAVARGWGRVEWSVLDWNKPAIRFYASIGADSKPEWVLQRLTGPALRNLAVTFSSAAPPS